MDVDNKTFIGHSYSNIKFIAKTVFATKYFFPNLFFLDT